MLDDKTRAELDQAVAALIELYPPTWRGLYLGCVSEGFTPDEALALVKTHILSNASEGVNGV